MQSEDAGPFVIYKMPSGGLVAGKKNGNNRNRKQSLFSFGICSTDDEDEG